MAFWDFSQSDEFDFELAKSDDAYVLTFQDSERYVDIKLSREGITQVKRAIMRAYDPGLKGDG